ncbi:Leucine-rich repeat, cysteine-containing subtype [Artemisia annua]|uniref:Leucine-rich repeat, cysteine-containing subtype n=1 Tax=Artemisia annua TaxID=35608 RepID=A0A2U1NCC5_ARTAN|nr:Leucine-rich repeat, cysteine-containing subtype [Artemisia annua]
MVGLESLDLSKCGENVTDSGVMAISQLPSIRSLDLSWLINVTDISLFRIAIYCLELIEICLAGCKAITGSGLDAFAHHQTLESLDLSSCPNISWNDVECVGPTLMMIKILLLSKSIRTQMPEALRGLIQNMVSIILYCGWIKGIINLYGCNHGLFCFISQGEETMLAYYQ